MESSIQEENGLSLVDLINIFKKNILIIIISTVLFIFLGFFYCFGIHNPTYKSTAVLMIQVVESGQVNNETDVSLGLKIVNTIAEFIQSEAIIDEVSQKLDINRQTISNNLSVSYSSTSLNITISYSSKNASEICDVLNSIIYTSRDWANSVDEDGDYVYPTIAKTISIVYDATRITKTGMGRSVLLAIFTMIGGIVGVVIALLKELLNNTVQSMDDIEKSSDLKVIGIIPLKKKKTPDEIFLIKDFLSTHSEAIQKLQVNIDFTSVDEKVKVIGVTSASQGEGKSTTIANLANIYAFKGQKVLLIDLDFRRSTIHKYFELPNKDGIIEYCSDKISQQELIKKVNDNLHVIVRGEETPVPTKVLDSNKLKNLINKFRDEYDYILLDTPPVLVVADSLLVSRYSDAFLFIAEQNSTKKADIKESLKVLNINNVNVIGAVLTQARISNRKYSYYYSESK